MDFISQPYMMAFWFGAFSALSLPLGAIAGIWLKPKNMVIAALMAFGAGALVAALTLELVHAGLRRMEYDPKPVGLGCLIGAIVFVVLNKLLNDRGAFLRKYSTAVGHLKHKKKKRVEELIESMSRIDIFRAMPPEEVQDIIPHVEDRDFQSGTVIFRKGDVGDALYLIRSGSVRIEMEGGKSVTLGEDATFGEMALLWNEPRTASAVAETDVKTWEVHAQDFEELIASSPILRSSVSELAEHRRKTGGLKKVEVTPEDWQKDAMSNVREEHYRPTMVDIRKEAHESGSGAALAMWLGIFIDGIPESIVIGAGMTGASVSPALIGGLFLANLPESMSSATMMKRNGSRTGKILMMWLSLMIMTAFGALIGNLVFQGIGHSTHALFEGLAAGAMLAMIAQTMLPEAYERGGGLVGIMTVLGFLVAVFLKGPPIPGH